MSNQKLSIQRRIKDELAKYLRLRWSAGDLEKEQKILQNEFYDDRIKVGFHVKDKNFQVWYMAPSLPYCLFTTPGPFNVHKVINDIKCRQQSVNEQTKNYLSVLKKQKQEKAAKIADIAKECSDTVHKIARGKISCTVLS